MRVQRCFGCLLAAPPCMLTHVKGNTAIVLDYHQPNLSGSTHAPFLESGAKTATARA